MSLELKDLVPGTVAIDHKGAICVVTEVHPGRPAWPLVFAVKASGAAYGGRPDLFKAVVGKVDLEAFRKASEAGVAMRLSAQPLFGCPDNLKGLNVGDQIRVKHGAGVAVATYEGYKHNRPTYPISYSVNGRRYKGMVGTVLGKAA